MAIKVKCPNPACGQSLSVPEKLLGRSLACPACQQPVHIGRFQIRARLGAGAFGAVYRAFDPQLEREVALKVPRPETLGEAEAKARFLREAKAAARLHHPHIVPVYETGEDGDGYFIAAAFIAGQPLSKLIPPGGCDPREAARLVMQLAEALAYAHEQGVLHRDVKPANALVDSKGTLYLTDFGLAGWLHPNASRLTHSGAILGTPGYMAPEQARGDTQHVGPAADQYSAGVTLYHLLTGKLPFEGPVAQVIHDVIDQSPPPVLELRPQVDPPLAAICHKAMAKRVDERFPDCHALASTLAHWLHNITTPHTTLSYHPQATGVLRRSDEAIPFPPLTERAFSPRLRSHSKPAASRHARLILLGSAAIVVTALLGIAVVVTTARKQSPTTLAQYTGATASERDSSPSGDQSLKPPDSAGSKTASRAPTREMPLSTSPALTKTESNTERPRDDRQTTAAEQPVAPKNPPSPEPPPLPQPNPPPPAPVLMPPLMNMVGMKMVWIPAGSFFMGSPDTDADALEHERPQHRVTLSHGFYMGVHLVTQKQYRQVMGASPSHFSATVVRQNTDEFPVDSISWEEALEFCHRLSEKERRTYRLPSEAEWEFACRGGAATRYYFGDSAKELVDYAWCAENSQDRTHPVGQKKPNGFGLYDMQGNLCQWCADWYNRAYYHRSPAIDPLCGGGQMRIIRGGSWRANAASCRCAARHWSAPGRRHDYLGFRVVAEPVAGE